MIEQKKLLIATHNKAKLNEFRMLLKDAPLKLVSLTDLGITYDVEETGATFKENAILKAKTYADMTGLLTMADDSGLEIDALNGEPGIYSRRYAGDNATDEQKRQFVLNKLKNVPEEDREARFYCVVAVAHPQGNVECFDGAMEGYIAFESFGPHIPEFPYCSIFWVPEEGRTITQLVAQGKHSAKLHRSIAVKKALSTLL